MKTKKKMFKNALYSYHLSNGFIGVELCKCPNCNGSIKEQNYDYIEHIPCEYDDYCPKCDTIVGHFAYGSYEPICDLKENTIRKLMFKAYKKEKKKMEKEAKKNV